MLLLPSAGCCCCCPLAAAAAPCRVYLGNRAAAVSFLNAAERVFVVDGFACWDPAVSSSLQPLLLLLLPDG
jgi:hypothetical protein